ncbi:MAG TPA: DUF993 family protein [Acidimicrobiia bacterium]|nr:DUF993 family protein [Acidimicrobiia bacterium]
MSQARTQLSAHDISELLRLADRVGLIADPDLTATRMRRILSLAGID